ncbi:MAG: hypothetical protein O7I42_11895, partial [Alphaproteobacteria bacterium]|nr:hypothetical protein [Alphaproteobacteria bacterium]
ALRPMRPIRRFVNLCVLKDGGQKFDKLNFDIEPNKRGIRKQKYSKGINLENKTLNEYINSFWLGDLPRVIWSPWPLFLYNPLSKTEMCELIPVTSRKVKVVRVEKIHEDKLVARTYSPEPEYIATASIKVPKRNYYEFPRYVNSKSAILLYHGGIGVNFR